VHRAFLRGLLVASVVLAGCGAVGPSGPPERDPTVTPATVPLTPPPGLSEEGVVNASALVAAHAGLLDATAATRVSNRTVRYPNGTLRTENRTTLSGPRARLVVVRNRTPGPEGALAFARWQNDSLVVGWVEREGTRQYYRLSTGDAPRVGVDDDRAVLSAALGGAADPAVDAVECGEERCLRLTFRLASVADPRAELTATSPVRYELTVTTDGLVHERVATWSARVDGRSVTVRDRVAYRGVNGTTVGAPGWVATGGTERGSETG
jgi:hypothetical protein